jgi:hypothetical protein
MFRRGFVGAGAALWLIGCGGAQPAGPVEHDRQVVELEAAEAARVDLTMGAGELTVTGGAAALVEAEFDYNVPAWKPVVTATSAGGRRDVRVSQDADFSTFGNTTNRWRIALDDAVPMDLVARVGAGEGQLTLGSLNLRNVELRLGAGQLTVDLRGTPTTSYTVSVTGGVGQATVYVPTSVAISARASGGLGEISVTGLEKRGDRWVNPRAESSPVSIDLDVTGGVGEIRIVAE